MIISVCAIWKNICTLGDESLLVQFECKTLMSALIKKRVLSFHAHAKESLLFTVANLGFLKGGFQ